VFETTGDGGLGDGTGGDGGLGGTGANVPGTPIVPEGITAAESAQSFQDAKEAEIAKVQAAAAASGAPFKDYYVGGDPTAEQEKFMEEHQAAAAMVGREAWPAAYGGRTPAAFGGIMDSATGRKGYKFGSFNPFKAAKKAVKTVGKLLKSPVGMMALTGLLGGQAGLFGKGIQGQGWKKFLGSKLLGAAANAGYSMPGRGVFTPETSGWLGKLGLTKGGGSLMPTLKGGLALGLGIPTALDMLGLGKDDDDQMDLDEYYRRNGIDIADIRMNPYNYLAPRFAGSRFAADGGLMRMGYQEGGDAEPVAKKTMPLLDMDGQEKDYRETGGFVDMGRMERADDVPARLSKNEFVFTADAVRNAGEGDIDKGAEVMYNMMKNLESGGEVSEESQGLDGAREMFQTSQRLEEVI
jgi:hypothetical protein